MSVFVDTNFFIRFLENDNPKQCREVEQLFLTAISGKKELISSVIVCFEIYWVMKSFYDKEDKEIQEILIKLMELNFIKWENAKVLKMAIKTMNRYGYDLEDSYNTAYAHEVRVDEIASFDVHLQKRWRADILS